MCTDAEIRICETELEKVTDEMSTGGEVQAARTKSGTADSPFWQWTMEPSSGEWCPQTKQVLYHNCPYSQMELKMIESVIIYEKIIKHVFLKKTLRPHHRNHQIQSNKIPSHGGSTAMNSKAISGWVGLTGLRDQLVLLEQLV